MANALNGEVSLQHAGETFTLRFSIDALCRLEERFDLTAAEILERLLGSTKVGFLRSVLFEGLIDQHEGLTERAAGEIIGSYGVVPMIGQIVEAWGRAFPKAIAKATGEADPDPQKAAAGTGSGS